MLGSRALDHRQRFGLAPRQEDRAPFVQAPARDTVAGSKLPVDVAGDGGSKLRVPRDLKRAGITPEQWEQFQRALAEYEKMQRQHQANIERLTGGYGASQAVRQVEAGPNQQRDPLQGGITSPPPEFRDAQRRFTSEPK